MARIHLFNPENDLALAAGTANYTPPPMARMLHRCGAALPLWYACRADGIIAPGLDRDWLAATAHRYDLEVSLSLREGLCAPWGWSENACRQFIDAGVRPSALPDKNALQHIRQLSHRRITVPVMERLRQLLDMPLPATPVEITSTGQLRDHLAHHPGCIVKVPWSSSGRGIIDSSLLTVDELARRVDGTIRRQGSVMCEERLDKITDFAMLFHSDGTTVEYAGLSCFFNHRQAAYAGNIVAPDDVLARHIGITPHQQHTISSALQHILTSLIAPGYQGYLGVDMMTYRTPHGLTSIAPCIEVNLRMTMGVVAMQLCRRILAPGSQAIMRITPATSSATATATSDTPVVRHHRLASGTQHLVPPGQPFSITLQVTPDAIKN